MTQYTEADTESSDVEVINPDNNSPVHELDCAPTQPAQATEAATPNTQTRFFPFLKLPRELRDQIYHHAVVRHGGPICIQRDHQDNLKDATLSCISPDPISIPLARVCKQVHTEVIPLLYSKNSFSIYSDNNMRDFLTHFAPNTNLMRHLILDGVIFRSEHMRSNARLDELIANFSCLLPLENLESLQMWAMFITTREDALSTFVKGIRGWAEVVGARAGDRYKVLDVMKGCTVFAASVTTDDAPQGEELEEELRRRL